MRFLSIILAAVLLSTAAVKAQMTNGLSDAEIKGRELARQLCEARPEQNFTNSGVLKTRDGKGKTSETQVKFETICTSTNWSNIYHGGLEDLTVTHAGINGSDYCYHAPNGKIVSLTGNQTMFPFAGSDFWLCDLGLEFFHWPQQKLLPKKTSVKRGRDYILLESTNPNPPTNGYSRVLSWIDQETGGILEAEAYDAQGKLLKDFAPKEFKKVNGQWELQEMEIRNVQTGSRTRLDFDLKK